VARNRIRGHDAVDVASMTRETAVGGARIGASWRQNFNESSNMRNKLTERAIS